MLEILLATMPEDVVKDLYQASEGTNGWGPLVGKHVRIIDVHHASDDQFFGGVYEVTHDWHPQGQNAVSVRLPGEGILDGFPGEFQDDEYEVVEEADDGSDAD